MEKFSDAEKEDILRHAITVAQNFKMKELVQKLAVVVNHLAQKRVIGEENAKNNSRDMLSGILD